VTPVPEVTVSPHPLFHGPSVPGQSRRAPRSALAVATKPPKKPAFSPMLAACVAAPCARRGRHGPPALRIRAGGGPAWCRRQQHPRRPPTTLITWSCSAIRRRKVEPDGPL